MHYANTIPSWTNSAQYICHDLVARQFELEYGCNTNFSTQFQVQVVMIHSLAQTQMNIIHYLRISIVCTVHSMYSSIIPLQRGNYE